MTIVLIDSIAIPMHKHATRRVKVSLNPRGKWSQRSLVHRNHRPLLFPRWYRSSHARRAGFSACIPSSLSSPFVTGRVDVRSCDQDRRMSGHRSLSLSLSLSLLFPREFTECEITSRYFHSRHH